MLSTSVHQYTRNATTVQHKGPRECRIIDYDHIHGQDGLSNRHSIDSFVSIHREERTMQQASAVDAAANGKCGREDVVQLDGTTHV